MSYGDLELADILAFPIPMPTVIARVYTTEGFVIGAEGRNFHFETSTILSDSVQKIFAVKQRKRELAYSFTGTVGITPKDSEEVVFDFLSETAKAIEALAERRLKSLWHYASALREELWPLPDLAKQALSTFESPLQETTIFLDGYYDGLPKRAHIKLFFDGQQVPEVSADPLHPGAVLGAASMEVLKVLMSDADDRLLAAYQTPVFGIATLEDAIRATKTVIAAHCDPQALTVDPKCAAMGGHVHICKLTFADGFQWLPGFEPI